MPKGFLGKLDPEDTATWALCQPRASSPLSRLRVWLMGGATIMSLLCPHPSHLCGTPPTGAQSRAGGPQQTERSLCCKEKPPHPPIPAGSLQGALG